MRHSFEWQVAHAAITKGHRVSYAKHRSPKLTDWRTAARQRNSRDQIQRQEYRQRFHGANLQRQARQSQVMRRACRSDE
jgi:hypothetical protein